MPAPAPDRRYLILSTTDVETVTTAVQRCGGDPKTFCAQANVRDVATYFRAVARGAVMPHVAAALIATADRINGSQSAA